MNDNEILACLRQAFPEVDWRLDEVRVFLKTVGLMNPGGMLYKEREKKLYEVVHFSSQVNKCVTSISRKKEVALLDCGCGRSYLPFFLNYILRKLRRRLMYLGVDSNADLIERSSKIRDELGFAEMQFFRGSLIEFEPEASVSIVSALHACDTATDEAIAKGIKLAARFIIAAPCCQRQVVRQVGRASKKVQALKPLVETKASKEYIGIALTETLRKLALESFGYEVDMFEFVSPTYTPKNIMLRAEKKGQWNSGSLKAYRDLRDYFNIEPRIQEYLAQLK